eukprot:403366180
MPFTKFIKFFNDGQKIWMKIGSEKWCLNGYDYEYTQLNCSVEKVITHSGETHTSFIFNQILQSLLEDNPQIKKLRQKYEIILVPCVCPDGVILGNSRVNSLGYDLNRQWERPDQDLHPEILSLKRRMQSINQQQIQNLNLQIQSRIQVFCDIHCHSKKLSSFFYGCNTASKGGLTSWTKTRLLPRIFAKKNHRLALKKCEYKITQDKLGTGRVVAWDEFIITNSFTFENSFYGYRDIKGEIQCYKKQDYEELGKDFLLSLFEFHMIAQQLEKDLVKSNGWLRPNKLLEMTGESALEIAQRMAQKQKLLQERQINIEQYKDQMRNEDYYQMIQALQEAKQSRKKKTQVIGNVNQLDNFMDNSSKSSARRRQNAFLNSAYYEKVTPQHSQRNDGNFSDLYQNKNNTDFEDKSNNQFNMNGQNNDINEYQLDQSSQDVMKIQISLRNTSRGSFRLKQDSIQNDQISIVNGSIKQTPLKPVHYNQNQEQLQSEINIEQVRFLKQASTIDRDIQDFDFELTHRDKTPRVRVNVRNITQKNKNADNPQAASLTLDVFQLDKQQEFDSGDELYMQNCYNWRDYFSVKELQNVAEQIQQGKDPMSEKELKLSDSVALVGKKQKQTNKFSLNYGRLSISNKNSLPLNSQTQNSKNQLLNKSSQLISNLGVENSANLEDLDKSQQLVNKIKLKPIVQRININEIEKSQHQNTREHTSIKMKSSYNTQKFQYTQDEITKAKNSQLKRNEMSSSNQLGQKHLSGYNNVSYNEYDKQSEINLSATTPTPYYKDMKFQISVKKISQEQIKIDTRHNTQIQKSYQLSKGIINNRQEQSASKYPFKLVSQKVDQIQIKQQEQTIQKIQQYRPDNVFVDKRKSDQDNQVLAQAFFNSVVQQKQDVKVVRKQKRSPQANASSHQIQRLDSQDSNKLKSIEVRSYNQSLGNKKSSQNVSRSRRIQEQITQNQTVFMKEQYPIMPIMPPEKKILQPTSNKKISQEKLEQLQLNLNNQKNSNMAFCTMFFKQPIDNFNTNTNEF